MTAPFPGYNMCTQSPSSPLEGHSVLGSVGRLLVLIQLTEMMESLDLIRHFSRLVLVTPIV